MEKPLEELSTRHLIMKLRTVRKYQSLTRTDWDLNTEQRDEQIAELELDALKLKKILKTREHLPNPRQVRQEKAKFHRS